VGDWHAAEQGDEADEARGGTRRSSESPPNRVRERVVLRGDITLFTSNTRARSRGAALTAIGVVIGVIAGSHS
jgi:hypothetical protein